MNYSGIDLQWDVRPSCLLHGGLNGTMFNEVKSKICIFILISCHTTSSIIGLERILLTSGPKMRKYFVHVPYGLAILVFARCCIFFS